MASRSIKDILQDLTIEELDELADQFQIGYPARLNKDEIINTILKAYNSKFFNAKTKREFENALLGEELNLTRAFENMDLKEEKKAGARAKSPSPPVRRKSLVQEPIFTREKLKSMTVQQLKKYATDSLIYIPSNIKKDEIINTILKSYSKKSVEKKSPTRSSPRNKSPTRSSPRNKSPRTSPRSELFSGGFVGVKNLIASLVSNYYLFTVKWKDNETKSQFTEKYIVSVPEELNDYFSEKKSGYFDTKMFFGEILKEKFPEKFIQNKLQITVRSTDYNEEGIEMSLDFYDFIPHLGLYNTYTIKKRGEDIDDDDDEENGMPSLKDINHAKKMIEYAKRGDYDSFYKNMNKLNDQLTYYVISNIPMDFKFTRLFFLGDNPIIFRGRHQYVGIDFKDFEYSPKNRSLAKNFSPLTPEQLSEQISKELKHIKSGELKKFESVVLKHALSTKNKKLFDGFIDAIQMTSSVINTFITQILEQAVIQDDYEICLIILNRLLNNKDSKLVLEHMLDVAKSQRNVRMINLFETVLKNPRNWKRMI